MTQPNENSSQRIAPRALRFQRRLRRVLRSAGFQRNWYLVVVAAGIGCVTAVGAVMFAFCLHLGIELMFWIGDHSSNWTWLALGLPVVGALATGVVVHLGAPEAKGHGVPEVMAAIYRNKGQILPRVAIVKPIASILTIGSGGSAGAEGPIVQIGSAIGSNVGRLLRTSPEHTSTLLGCGAAAGIASVFNAPIAGIFFVLEILLRDFSLRTFTPIVIASVFSAAMTEPLAQTLGLRDGPGTAIFQVAESLETHPFHLLELPYFLILGVACGIVAVMFIRALDWTDRSFEKIKVHPILKPAIGATMLWMISVILMQVLASGPDPHPIPHHYGNGYRFVIDTLLAGFYSEESSYPIVLFLLLMVALKLVATCLTLGSGGSGGVFAPSLFLGAACGGAIGMMIQAVDPFGISPGPAAYALVGMAAVVAGTTHAPLTAILMLFEITGNYKVIVPIMMAAMVSTILAQVLCKESIYTVKLKRQGIRVGTHTDHTLLRRIQVSSVPLAHPLFVNPNEPARRLLELAETHNAVDFVVVDDDKHYLGMVLAEDLRTTLLQIEALPLLVVAELMRTDIRTTSPLETLDIVMDKFSQHDGESMAVLDPAASNRVLGVMTRSRMMRQYHLALEA